MYKYNRILIKHAVLLLVMLCSCAKEIEIDLPNYDSEFVLGGLFNNTDTLCIYIGQTQSLNDTCYNISGNIEAIVSYDGNTDTLIESDEEGLYTSKSLVPKEGVTYSIVVSGDDKRTVTANNTLSSVINFDINNLQIASKIDNDGEYYSTATLTFSDPDNSEDYYLLGIRDISSVSTDDIYLWSDDILINGDEFTNESLDDEAYNLYFSDDLINGETTSINFNFYFDEPFYDDEYLQVYLRHITKEYYNYITTFYLHYSNQQSDIWDGSGSPVNTYTNVDNGYGIFAGYTETTYKIEF